MYSVYCIEYSCGAMMTLHFDFGVYRQRLSSSRLYHYLITLLI